MTRFRPARAGDVDAIVGMMRGYYGEDSYTFVEDEARAAALMLIEVQGLGRLWVTSDGDTVVGYVAVALGFSLEYRGRERSFQGGGTLRRRGSSQEGKGTSPGVSAEERWSTWSNRWTAT